MPTGRRIWRSGAAGLALAAALCATAAQADSTAHNGWQCTARTDSVSVYHWLKAPQTEAGVTVTDSNPTSELLDTSLRYGASPTNQYFYFEVKLGADHKVTRDGVRVELYALKVEIGDGTKVLAKGMFDTTREFTLMDADFVPLASAISNPATRNLTVRLLDSAGKPLASYSVPVAGFVSAGQAAAAMMGKPGTDGTGKECA